MFLVESSRFFKAKDLPKIIFVEKNNIMIISPLSIWMSSRSTWPLSSPRKPRCLVFIVALFLFIAIIVVVVVASSISKHDMNYYLFLFESHASNRLDWIFYESKKAAETEAQQTEILIGKVDFPTRLLINPRLLISWLESVLETMGAAIKMDFVYIM